MGKASWDFSNYTYAVASPITDGACCGHADYCDKSAGETWSEEFESDNDGYNRQCDKRARQMSVVQVPQGEESLAKKPVAACFDAEHLVYLTNCNLHTDSRKKADKHSSREEVGKEAKAKEPGEKEYGSGNECDETGKLDISRSIGNKGKSS